MNLYASNHIASKHEKAKFFWLKETVIGLNSKTSNEILMKLPQEPSRLNNSNKQTIRQGSHIEVSKESSGWGMWVMGPKV